MVRLRVLLRGKLAALGCCVICVFAWLGVGYMLSSEAPAGFEARATAKVTRVEAIEIDGRTRFEHYYSFTDGSGVLQSTSSITRHLVGKGQHQVEYDPHHPSHAQLVDASDHEENVGHEGVIFFLFVVGLGFALLLLGLRAPRRTLRFLRRSKPGIARVTAASNRNKNGVVWTKLAFEYDDDGTLRTGSVERRDVPALDVYKKVGIRFLSDQAMTQFELPHGTMTADGALTARDGSAWLLALVPAAALSGAAMLIALTLVELVR